MVSQFYAGRANTAIGRGQRSLWFLLWVHYQPSNLHPDPDASITATGSTDAITEA